MNKYIIYKVENINNGFVYIGATTSSLNERKLDHIQKANKETGHQFQEAIGTYGPEAFSWIQVDTANTISELARKEKEYIFKYDCKENGYNQDAGGGFKKTVYQYSVDDGLLVGQYDSLESAANAVSAYKTCVGNACIGQNNTCKGYYWSYYLSSTPIYSQDQRKKGVVQYSLNGDLIAEYNSVAEASKETGISKTCISRVCRKERKKSGGFKWEYV
jgi:hypothetical protein